MHDTAALHVLSPCRSLKDDLLPHVTGGFRGRTIRVASIDYSPWMIFQRDSTGRTLTSEKYSIGRRVLCKTHEHKVISLQRKVNNLRCYNR
jgi:hypothetical protein